MYKRQGRDGIYFFARRDGTVHIIFHDGTGRYIIVRMRERDGPFYFFDETGRYIFVFQTGWDGTFSSTGRDGTRDGTWNFPGRDGTVCIFFHCAGERNARTHGSRHLGSSVRRILMRIRFRASNFGQVAKIKSHWCKIETGFLCGRWRSGHLFFCSCNSAVRFLDSEN